MVLVVQLVLLAIVLLMAVFMLGAIMGVVDLMYPTAFRRRRR